MNQDLLERYLYAVTRGLPKRQREDVAQELRGLVEDMLQDRCGKIAPTEKDLRVVLTELGTPQELYEKYSGEAGKCLIGQPYYSTYKLVLSIVLICAGVGITIANGILLALETQNAAQAVLSWLAMLWDTLLGAFAFVTLLFAFFSWRKIPLGNALDFDNLPPVPRKRERISRWECAAGIGFCVVFLVVFLGVPQIFCAVLPETGEIIPIFDADTLRQGWLWIVLFAACGISREMIKLIEGRYNRRVLGVTVGTNLLSGILAILWLMKSNLISREFLSRLNQLFGQEEEIVVTLFSNFQMFFLGVMLFALAFDTAEAAVRTLRK